MALLTLEQTKQMQAERVLNNEPMSKLARKYGISRFAAISYLHKLENEEFEFFAAQECRDKMIELARECAKDRGLGHAWREFLLRGGNASRDQFRALLIRYGISYKKNFKNSRSNGGADKIKADLLADNFTTFASLARVHDVSNNYVGMLAKELGIKAKCPHKEGLREDIKTVLKGCEKPLTCREIGRILKQDVIKVRSLVYHLASCDEVRAARRGNGKIYMHEYNENIENFDWSDIVAVVKAPVQRKKKNTQPYKPNYTLLQKIALGIRI